MLRSYANGIRTEGSSFCTIKLIGGTSHSVQIRKTYNLSRTYWSPKQKWILDIWRIIINWRETVPPTFSYWKFQLRLLLLLPTHINYSSFMSFYSIIYCLHVKNAPLLILHCHSVIIAIQIVTLTNNYKISPNSCNIGRAAH